MWVLKLCTEENRWFGHPRHARPLRLQRNIVTIWVDCAGTLSPRIAHPLRPRRKWRNALEDERIAGKDTTLLSVVKDFRDEETFRRQHCGIRDEFETVNEFEICSMSSSLYTVLILFASVKNLVYILKVDNPIMSGRMQRLNKYMNTILVC
mmetsp:Transcript_51446/g.60130  ORF Transcript_51446/g.60130 Transcript_51446/m.60130 type:complete len:151 (+) Transcript_51446:103-555(+)